MMHTPWRIVKCVQSRYEHPKFFALHSARRGCWWWWCADENRADPGAPTDRFGSLPFPPHPFLFVESFPRPDAYYLGSVVKRTIPVANRNKTGVGSWHSRMVRSFVRPLPLFCHPPTLPIVFCLCYPIKFYDWCCRSCLDDDKHPPRYGRHMPNERDLLAIGLRWRPSVARFFIKPDPN